MAKMKPAPIPSQFASPEEYQRALDNYLDMVDCYREDYLLDREMEREINL